MIYTTQYDDMLGVDSLDCGVDQVDLDRVLENNDISYIMDLDDIR